MLNLFHLVLPCLLLSFTLATNHCEISKCVACKKVGENFSCDKCYDSQRIKDPENASLFKCNSKDTIENCKFLKVDEIGISLETPCDECEVGYYLNSNKTKCLKFKTKCLSSSVILEQNYCDFCWQGYSPKVKKYTGTEDLSCIKIEKKNLTENCAFYGFGNKCVVCKTGFRLKSETEDSKPSCIKDIAEGCVTFTEIAGQKKCLSCDTFRGYWPVGSEPQKGAADIQNCKYKKSTDYSKFDFGKSSKDDNDMDKWRVVGMVGAAVSFVCILLSCLWLRSINHEENQL